MGGTVLPEAGVDTHFFEHEINVGHTMMISPHMLNQLHFLVGKADNRTDSITDLPQTIVSGAFTGAVPRRTRIARRTTSTGPTLLRTAAANRS